MKLLSSELDSINTISYSEFRETFKGNLNTIEINPWLLKNTIQALWKVIAYYFSQVAIYLFTVIDFQISLISIYELALHARF